MNKSSDRVLVNGRPAGRIHPLDRGLLYGDGVFRTLKAGSGRIEWWADQYAKLAGDSHALGLDCPLEEQLRSECLELAKGEDCVIRITLTRGQGPRGYAPPANTSVTRIVHASPLPVYPPQNLSQGVRVRWCTLRLGQQKQLAGIKHLNRLENVLARTEWSDADISEGLLLDREGWVIGGVMSNILLMRGKTLFTPDLSLSGVAGVTRTRIMRAAMRNGLDVRESQLRPQDIYRADECCLCNSLIGVWRIRMIEDMECGDRGWADKLRNWLNEIN
jgi:4-amino-4-deoxychorismate lyase